MLADTPEIPIRSVPMGLAEIHGRGTGESLFTTPVTHVACLFFKVQIDRYVGTGRHANFNGISNWAPIITDADGVPFYLEDGTGKIKLFPRVAELDLPSPIGWSRSSAGEMKRIPRRQGTWGSRTTFASPRKIVIARKWPRLDSEGSRMPCWPSKNSVELSEAPTECPRIAFSLAMSTA